MSRTNRTGKLKRRLKTSIGGIVEGIKVPRTKEDPAEARNPITGQPYQETTGLLASLRRLKNPRMRRQDGGELRIDGTKKSMQGFLGPIKNSRGQIMTELSIGVEMDGKEIEIPTLVPTLNDQDIQVLQNLSDDAPIPESIIKKSVAHAQERMKENKDPFYQDGEEEERANFDNGGPVRDELLEFILSTEDSTAYEEYKKGNLDHILKAHTGGEDYKNIVGGPDKSTILGLTETGKTEMTLGDAVDRVRADLLTRQNKLYNHLGEEAYNNMDQRHRESVISLMFNVGDSRALGSQALKNLVAGDLEGYYYQAGDPKIGFVKSQDKVIEGLINRRAQEQEYAKGIWEPR